MTYAYLIGSLALGVVWVLFYLFRRDLHKEIVTASLLAAPLGLSQYFYVHEYWSPPTLFDLARRTGFDIESILFSFFVGGIAAVAYEVCFSRRLVKGRFGRHVHIGAYAVIVLGYVLIEFVAPTSTIYNLMIVAILATVVIVTSRPDLIVNMFISGVVFGGLYFILFLAFNALFSEFISTTYALENFWGIFALGVPLEEIMFAFWFGVVWSALYEYTQGYRLRSIAS